MFCHIIIRGPLGVGKTTIAKEIAKKLNIKYISVDEVLEDNKLIKLDKGKIALKSFLSANQLIIRETKGVRAAIDGNFYYKKQIEHFKNLSNKSIIFTLTAPLELCMKRDKAREKSYGEDAVKAVYTLVKKVKYGINIDATKSKEEIIKQIISQMDSSSRQGKCRNS